MGELVPASSHAICLDRELAVLLNIVVHILNLLLVGLHHQQRDRDAVLRGIVRVHGEESSG